MVLKAPASSLERIVDRKGQVGVALIRQRGALDIDPLDH